MGEICTRRHLSTVPKYFTRGSRSFERCTIRYERTSSCIERVETSIDDETIGEFSWVGDVVFWESIDTVHECSICDDNSIYVFHTWIDVYITSLWISSCCSSFCDDDKEIVGVVDISIDLDISTFSVDDFWSCIIRRGVDGEEIVGEGCVVVIAIGVTDCWS